MKTKFYFVVDTCIKLHVNKKFEMTKKEIERFKEEAKILCENLKELKKDELEYLEYEAFLASVYFNMCDQPKIKFGIYADELIKVVNQIHDKCEQESKKVLKNKKI